MNFTVGIDQKLDTMLRDLAAKLGVTVHDLWQSGIQYTYATGIADLVVAGILFSLILVAILTIYLLRKDNANDGVRFFLGLGALVTLVPTTLNLYFGIRAILAPEGVLLMNIMQMLTAAKK